MDLGKLSVSERSSAIIVEWLICRCKTRLQSHDFVVVVW